MKIGDNEDDNDEIEDLDILKLEEISLDNISLEEDFNGDKEEFSLGEKEEGEVYESVCVYINCIYLYMYACKHLHIYICMCIHLYMHI
jgi:hypothetical protein